MKKNPAQKITYYICTTALMIVFVSPLVWAAISSVSPAPGTSQTKGYGFNNYVAMWNYGIGFPSYLWNSLIVSVVAVVLTIVIAVTAGYAFARFNFPGKNALFVLVLSVMMVPVAALLVPMMVWMQDIRMHNSLVGVGLVLTLFQLPFGVFLMRNSFAAVPRELEEAAMIDGCNPFKAFIRVMLPTATPSIITVGLFAYLAAWNDFMVALYLLASTKAPIPLALVNMRQQTMGVIDYGSTTAGVVTLTLPAIILFLALQKYYVKGFTSGAVKG